MLKPTTKFQILFWLSALNLIALGYALPNPLHAAGHGLLALGFAFWAKRVRPSRGEDEEAPDESRSENLDAEVSELRRQLSETQERLESEKRVVMREREEESGEN